MSVSKKDQKLILVLLGLVIFLVSYFGISKTFNNKKTDVETQISSLSSQAEELKGYYANQSSNQAEIDRIDLEISTERAKYPGDVRSEDLIMYATKLESEIGIKIEGISIASPDVISEFSIPEKSADNVDLLPEIAVRTRLTIDCTLSYAQLKKLIDYVYASAEKTGISDVSVSYNSETGGLAGTVTIDKYFITTTDYSYTPTAIPSVKTGKSDPFGTATTEAAPTPSASPNAG